MKTPQESTTLSRSVEVEGRPVEIPEGWKLAKGRVQPGDRHLHYIKFLGGVVEWFEAWTPPEWYRYADDYALLIRRIPEGTG